MWVSVDINMRVKFKDELKESVELACLATKPTKRGKYRGNVRKRHRQLEFYITGFICYIWRCKAKSGVFSFYSLFAVGKYISYINYFYLTLSYFHVRK